MLSKADVAGSVAIDERAYWYEARAAAAEDDDDPAAPPDDEYGLQRRRLVGRWLSASQSSDRLSVAQAIFGCGSKSREFQGWSGVEKAMRSGIGEMLCNGDTELGKPN